MTQQIKDIPLLLTAFTVHVKNAHIKCFKHSSIYKLLLWQLSFYHSPNIITVMESRKMKWMGHGTVWGDTRNAYKISVVKPECKRLLGKPKHRWEGIIKMNCKETVWRCEVDFTLGRWHPVVGSCKHNNKPLRSIGGRQFFTAFITLCEKQEKN
jgi:hypothetical protein